MPVIERARDRNGGGCRMSECKAYRHQLEAAALGAVMVVLVIGLFHVSNTVRCGSMVRYGV